MPGWGTCPHSLSIELLAQEKAQLRPSYGPGNISWNLEPSIHPPALTHLVLHCRPGMFLSVSQILIHLIPTTPFRDGLAGGKEV